MTKMTTTDRRWRRRRICPLENHRNSYYELPPTPPPPTPMHIKTASCRRGCFVVVIEVVLGVVFGALLGLVVRVVLGVVLLVIR